MRKSLCSLVLIGGLSCGSVAFAQDADLFSRLDANRDGVLTADEAGEEKKAIFERLLRKGDKDEDGKLTKDEFTAGLKDAPPQDAAPGGFGDNPAGRLGNFDPEQLLKRMDKNGDGKLQKDEAPDRLKENFDRLDSNSDGAVDAAEFRKVAAMMQGRPPEGRPRPASPSPGEGRPGMMDGPPGIPPFAMIFDQDKNGELSAEEVANASSALKKLDKNSDGKLTGEELVGAIADFMPAEMRRPDSPSPDGARPTAARPDAKQILERLKQADANGDGKLSKDEAPERLRERFDQIDANSDGFVDSSEVRKMLEEMRDQFGAGRPEQPEQKKRPDGDKE